MSKYSGKCDFYDTIEICGGYAKFIERYDHVYVGRGDDAVELTWSWPADLVPFYGNLVIMSVTSPNGGKIWLDEVPWVIRQAQHADRPLTKYEVSQLEDIYKEYVRERMYAYSL